MTRAGTDAGDRRSNSSAAAARAGTDAHARGDARCASKREWRVSPTRTRSQPSYAKREAQNDVAVRESGRTRADRTSLTSFPTRSTPIIDLPAHARRTARERAVLAHGKPPERTGGETRTTERAAIARAMTRAAQMRTIDGGSMRRPHKHRRSRTEARRIGEHGSGLFARGNVGFAPAGRQSTFSRAQLSASVIAARVGHTERGDGDGGRQQ